MKILTSITEICSESRIAAMFSSRQVCDTHDGAVSRFSGVALQAKPRQDVDEGVADLPRNALMRTRKVPLSLSQVGNTKLDQPMTEATAKVPVTSWQDDDPGALKCNPIPDCGCVRHVVVRMGWLQRPGWCAEELMADYAAAWEQMRVTSMLDGRVRDQLAEATAA